ncbi:MAG: hypothetical protein K6D95_06090 [Treponema sp.]|nr:hypothetical protein [Treponema sp.]
MKNSIFSRFTKLSLSALLLLSLAAFTGCPNNAGTDSTSDPVDSSLSVIGTWVDAGEYGNFYYEITESYFKNYGDYGYEGSDFEGYAGDNVTIVPESSTSGYIYIKYTRASETVYTEPEDAGSWTHYAASEWGPESWFRYSATAPDVGKWYAIHYQNLTASSVDISGAAGLGTGAVTSTETLDEAKAEFTVENEKTYFGTHTTCALVNE